MRDLRSIWRGLRKNQKSSIPASEEKSDEPLISFDRPFSTAIYPNRQADKLLVDNRYRLPEFGNEETIFFTPFGNVFAKGYNRIVYGDHGPYVEFEKRHIVIKTHRVIFEDDRSAYKPFYFIREPEDGSKLKIYDQKRDVKHLRNPPPGGFNGNRKEGYADYKPGKLYVSVFQFHKIKVS